MPEPPSAAQHPSAQPALPQRQATVPPTPQRGAGITRDLRAQPPARREPEWLIAAAERRIAGGEIADQGSRLSERATGRELVRRPVTETAVLPTASGSGFGGDDGGDDDLPPFDRGPSGGRHRGPRRPAFRAAVPIAAVLAAGGGALGLVHAVSNGAPGSQAMDMASGNNGTVTTTDLSNAPSGADGSTSGSATDPATSPLDATTSGGGTHSGLTPDPRTSGPGTRTTTAPGVPITTSGGTTTPSTPGLPVQTGPGLPSNGPILTSSTPPTTPPGSTAPVSSAPTTTPTSPNVPVTPTSGPTTPGTPTTTPTPTTPPSTPPTTDPSSPTQTPTGPTSTSTPPSSTPSPSGVAPSTPPTSPPTTPQISPSAGTLQPGDTGPNVTTLQTLLDRLDPPDYWVPVTGVYDTRTTDAVAYVQNMLKITADPRGVCGPATVLAINALAAGH